MPQLESQLIQWTVENNDAGAWSLCARIAGKRYQLSAWMESRDDVLKKLAEQFGVNMTPQPTEAAQ